MIILISDWFRFCSTGCRDSGLEDHLRQCRISETLSSIPDNVDSSITHILTVLNLMLKQSVDQHIETFHQWKTGEEHKDKDESTFLKILNMVKHFDCLDLRQHLASSVLILHLLQYLDYVNHDITTDVRSSLCIIICHYLGVVKSNIHTICELRNSNDNHLVIKPVGVGLYPAVASHVNHSCNPNTFVINIGSTQVTNNRKWNLCNRKHLTDHGCCSRHCCWRRGDSDLCWSLRRHYQGEETRVTAEEISLSMLLSSL